MIVLSIHAMILFVYLVLMVYPSVNLHCSYGFLREIKFLICLDNNFSWVAYCYLAMKDTCKIILTYCCMCEIYIDIMGNGAFFHIRLVFHLHFLHLWCTRKFAINLNLFDVCVKASHGYTTITQIHLSPLMLMWTLSKRGQCCDFLIELYMLVVVFRMLCKDYKKN